MAATIDLGVSGHCDHHCNSQPHVHRFQRQPRRYSNRIVDADQLHLRHRAVRMALQRTILCRHGLSRHLCRLDVLRRQPTLKAKGPKHPLEPSASRWQPVVGARCASGRHPFASASAHSVGRSRRIGHATSRRAHCVGVGGISMSVHSAARNTGPLALKHGSGWWWRCHCFLRRETQPSSPPLLPPLPPQLRLPR